MIYFALIMNLLFGAKTPKAVRWQVEWKSTFSEMASTSVSLNFWERKAHCYAVAVLPSLTAEPRSILGGIYLQKPLFG